MYIYILLYTIVYIIYTYVYIILNNIYNYIETNKYLVGDMSPAHYIPIISPLQQPRSPTRGPYRAQSGAPSAAMTLSLPYGTTKKPWGSTMFDHYCGYPLVN